MSSPPAAGEKLTLDEILSRDVPLNEPGSPRGHREKLRPEDDLTGLEYNPETGLWEAPPDGSEGAAAKARLEAEARRKKPITLRVWPRDGRQASGVAVEVVRSLPWDDFCALVSSKLGIQAVDFVLDAKEAQVTSVAYLEDGDVLQVCPLDDSGDSWTKSSVGGSSSTRADASALVGSMGLAVLPSDANQNAAADGTFDISTGMSFLERAKWVPLRLSLKERKVLRLVKAALQASHYTDNIDGPRFAAKPGDDLRRRKKLQARRLHAQLHEICAMLSGVVTALDYNEGADIIESRDFKRHDDFLQSVFEIARRHKILNPEKMRTSHGKLCYLLQDSMSEDVQELLQFSMFDKMTTVYTTLKAGGAEAMLRDPLIGYATMECPDDKTKTRAQLQRRINKKNNAIKQLSRKYVTQSLDRDTLQNCLYSIGDNSSYLGFNRDPIDKMIRLLTTFFSPDRVEEPFSLSIVAGDTSTATNSGVYGSASASSSGRPSSGASLGSVSGAGPTSGGARLTHSHGRQFHFVLQSLLLWRAVTNNMYKLWMLAEMDLMEQPYQLVDTGQGFNRLQQSPRVLQAMREILHATQQKCEKWIGSSVIHLGDKNVPNAIFFIDKYTQISRILRPIITAIEQLPRVAKNDGVARYIDSFGGVEMLTKTILHDFFRHGFDGGGASNFFDAGSCIDGRLTSAWNWCSQLHKKDFAPIFKLAGFTSFDGNEFQE